jgi:hypothetical protein
MQERAEKGPVGWARALALLFIAAVSWVGNPGILVAAPFALLVFLIPPRRALTVTLAAVGLCLVLVGGPSSGFWYLERGWAFLVGGCFLALSLRWPEGGFLPRGLGAVFGAYLVMGLFLGVRPGEWGVVDWLVKSRLEFTVSTFMQAMGPDVFSEAFELQALEIVALQGFVFPALLGLASLSGLGLAWWLFVRLNRRHASGIGPLKEFRFNDQLVWVLILGIISLVLSSGIVARLGVNAVVFMGALYALRGAAVVLFLTGGLSLFGGFLFVIGFVLLAPFVVLGAMVIGLGDTWFDLRKRGVLSRPEA